MANTLTNLIPTIYEARDIVSREIVGFIPAVSVDATAERAAKDQTIRVHIAPAGSASDLTPGTTPPDAGDNVFTSVTMSISKVRKVPIRWTGEEQLSVGGSGPGYRNLLRDQIAQAMRTLVNEIEIDLGNVAYQNASRAYGTAGTTPFASNLADAAQVNKILTDNGCPMGDRHLVIDTAAGVNLRTLAQLTRANEAGTDATLRRGELLELFGLSVRESAGIELHTNGTGTGYLVNNASGEAIGQTAITTDTGSGTILAGDFVTFAADATNKYVSVAAHAANTLTLGKPGLLVAAPDDNAITVGGDHTPNVAFHRSAVVLLARSPALPEGGDMADDRMTVVDPLSGLPFEFAVYKGYHRNYMEVSMAWGYAAIKNEHIAILLG